MKFLKRVGVMVALVAVCLFAYLFLGGIDAEHPAAPDLGLGVQTVKEEDNWYVALVAVTNLVSLTEDEQRFVSSASSSPREWWRIHDFASEKDALAKLDALIARHGELFKRLGGNVHRRGWWRPPQDVPADANPGHRVYEDCALITGWVVKLLDLKIKRELDQGEFMFAFADMKTFYSLGLAVMRGAEGLVACESAKGQLRKTMRRFMPFVTQLDGEQLAVLRQLLDEQAADMIATSANAYARQVAAAEAHFDWLYRRGGVEQMQANLLSALSSVSGKLGKGVEGVSRAAFKVPNFNRFSFHFNRSLARYYEESAKTHANLLRGKYDLAIRAQYVLPQNPKWNLPVYPNWLGRVVFASLAEQGGWSCLLSAASRFAVSADRVVIAANRYRLDKGEYPRELQALVPDYLDAVPDDPFGDGKLGFNVAQGTVHSVGENGGFDGVVPPEGAKVLHFTNENGVRRWYTPYIRRLDGKPLE